MAFDKVIDSAALDADLTSIADAIRSSMGDANPLDFPVDFVSAIESLGNTEDYLAAVCNYDVTEIVNNKITQVPTEFQKGNSALITLSLPNLADIPTYICQECTNLRTVDFSGATNMHAGCFGNCYALESVKLDSLETIESWGYNFNQCKKITRFDFPKLTGTITEACFHDCRALTVFILRANTVVPLANTNAFNKTPIALYNGTVGYIYVPKALVDSYKTATNWSKYAGQIRAIEDYPDICG